MRKLAAIAIAIVSLVAHFAFSPLAAFADEAKAVASDPILEQHVKVITEELRCLVCQNQTIADSHADLAIDLRNQVREKVKQGMSDKEILDYMVQRYGDFVLYRPPVKTTTWLLWFGPFLLLLGGLAILMWRVRRSATAEEAVPEVDLQRAAVLLRASPESTKE